ncbi:hypothetical protein F0U61_50705 [Archangium violaceum]|uniref:ADYC domain-containing protein n=1 Tax=Archangium violaceum TaxID=83451 RepID=UPI002B304F2A|nr:hypothetical protein F0U61_50705 [Archangium violaceum]
MRAGLNSRTATALAALVLGCWATQAAAGDPCTSPECKEGNGRGIYVVQGGNYCIQYNPSQQAQFCPEAFVLAGDSTTRWIELAGRHFKAGLESVQSHRVYARFKDQPVQLVGVDTKPTESRLIFYYYKSPAEPRVAVPENELAQLKLRVQSTPVLFEFSYSRVAGSTSPQYSGSWSSKAYYTNSGAEGEFCTSPGGQPKTALFLLPAKRVDGSNGKVTHLPIAATLACGSGAIVGCMKWGYNPSQLNYPDPQEDALLGACIQAKRAAYFGGAASYTKDNTPITITDNYAGTPVNGTVNQLEAIWTQNGAACFNPANRRIDTPPLPATPVLPTCPTAPQDWWALGMIATGK